MKLLFLKNATFIYKKKTRNTFKEQNIITEKNGKKLYVELTVCQNRLRIKKNINL